MEPAGPAARAGLQSGDWIVALDGQTMATVDELRRRLAAGAVGVPISVSVIKEGKSRAVSVIPAESR